MSVMNKYHATPTTVDGIRFASRAEAMRYQHLRLMEQAGAISGLATQPRFALVVNGLKICTYVADFLYYENGAEIIEDVKSLPTKTPIYLIKKKLLKAICGLDIREITMSARK
jgi:hypothetical protein